MMEKYWRLQHHLHYLRVNEWRATFSKIEDIIGQPLPPGARASKEWWWKGKDLSRNFNSWLDPAWEAAPDLDKQVVVFRRRK